jgi:DNA replication and repair protein RecF
MGLARLELRNFRCVQAASLEPHPETNLIVGDNGSGKTTLLETIHVLGTGRSFRIRELEPLVRRGTDGFAVLGETLPSRQSLEVRYGIAGLELRQNDHRLRGSTELAALLPVQALNPEMHALIEGAPEGRRRFLDWGAFHVKQGYVEPWRRYHRALRQRNAALKDTAPRRDLEAWNIEITSTGAALDSLRKDYAAELAARFAKVGTTLLGAVTGIGYKQGWPEGQTLEEALCASVERDRLSKATQVGPHRADLEITLGGTRARYAASRGQQKMLALALGLAQAGIVAGAVMRPLVLLLDDPAAEVDCEGAARLVEEVTRIRAQRFITGLRPESYPCEPNRVFHVKQGEFIQMI